MMGLLYTAQGVVQEHTILVTDPAIAYSRESSIMPLDIDRILDPLRSPIVTDFRCVTVQSR